ncbi:cellulase family glycosylhydrolase [Flavobacterium sp. UBA7682]|uniref:cellulase family glycosylhydrolase n=1 Tax=Flavobacterium sp. UBA7682 TaxID=1946560 RepID=UPI0025C0C7F7|nr:cellulase family glycosylhydrolase [Flavobacterium sp. UBA7682]
MLLFKKINVVFLLLSVATFGQGFLHRDGQKIVDGNGKNVLLRGLGIGGLMVQEGYMLKTADFAGPQYQIRQKITDLVGEKNAEEFYQVYKKNGLTKRDVDSLAAWGFNSIRLPMHYNLYTLPIEKEPIAGQNTWLEEGFTMTDDLLNWCAANKMYLILDLHAAPGGQGMDANISDYDTSKPSLWESTANQDKMVAFWRKLAERYKDNPWIGGYDIINEPNWNFSGTNKNGCDETKNEPLRALQMRITKAIREVDTNHLIIIEGNCWGNNYKGMFPLWDENIALSFHKYWSYNDMATIQEIVNYRKEYNVPIWLGETGENSNVWFKDVISLIESNNIGWAFWPMKKIENIAGVTSVKGTEGYDRLLQYWKDGKNKPSVEEAQAILMQIAENFKMENVIVKPDVIDAMFRQIQTTETKIYKKHTLPGKVFASEYDLGQINHAYFDKDVANYWVSNGGKRSEWNSGNQMRNDGVDIQKCDDVVTNGYAVSYIEDGEWLQYTFDLNTDKTLEVSIRFSAEKAGAKLHLADDNGTKLSKVISLPASGGNSKWKTFSVDTIKLKKGINKIRVHFENGDFNFNYLEFK